MRYVSIQYNDPTHYYYSVIVIEYYEEPMTHKSIKKK